MINNLNKSHKLLNKKIQKGQENCLKNYKIVYINYF